MKKKLQVFVSSTYLDLREERQAGVEAILSAGHIPAGMELFAAGNESQLETINRWISESDVYMLILGGRYGSIEPKSKKSYTQLEYEYALSLGIPVFTVVISDIALEQKVKIHGTSVIELENVIKYKSFKSLVLSKVCKFFDDNKDIKIAVHETLNDFQNRFKFTGWISGKEIPNMKSELINVIDVLSKFKLNELIEEMAVTNIHKDEKDIYINNDMSEALPEPLSPKEEKYYLDLLLQDDEVARSVLIERNLRKVVYTIRKYENYCSVEDLISIGTIGLINAVTHYNLNPNVEFSEYVYNCIENEVKDYINK